MGPTGIDRCGTCRRLLRMDTGHIDTQPLGLDGRWHPFRQGGSSVLPQTPQHTRAHPRGDRAHGHIRYVRGPNTLISFILDTQVHDTRPGVEEDDRGSGASSKEEALPGEPPQDPELRQDRMYPREKWASPQPAVRAPVGRCSLSSHQGAVWMRGVGGGGPKGCHPHLFTSSLPRAIRHARGPGTSRSQPRFRQGCRAAEPSSTCCRRHRQEMLCPAVKVKPKAASQLAGRRARPRHGPALSFPHKHCSGHPPPHTQIGASSPPGHRGDGRQPPCRFLQAGVSSLGLRSEGVLAEPESRKRATVRPHPGGREVGPRTTEGAPDLRLALGSVAWEVSP